jgi:hypothetical protein
MSSVLERLEAAIAAKQAELARLQGELSELETAARVLHTFEADDARPAAEARTTPIIPVPANTTNGVADTAPNADAAGKTIKDWAFDILVDRGPLHYREIAEEAVRRGYRSARDSGEATIVRSFWAILNRNTATFELAGRGVYRLKQSRPKHSEPTPHP